MTSLSSTDSISSCLSRHTSYTKLKICNWYSDIGTSMHVQIQQVKCENIDSTMDIWKTRKEANQTSVQVSLYQVR